MVKTWLSQECNITSPRNKKNLTCTSDGTFWEVIFVAKVVFNVSQRIYTMISPGTCFWDQGKKIHVPKTNSDNFLARVLYVPLLDYVIFIQYFENKWEGDLLFITQTKTQRHTQA